MIQLAAGAGIAVPADTHFGASGWPHAEEWAPIFYPYPKNTTTKRKRKVTKILIYKAFSHFFLLSTVENGIISLIGPIVKHFEKFL